MIESFCLQTPGLLTMLWSRARLELKNGESYCLFWKRRTRATPCTCGPPESHRPPIQLILPAEGTFRFSFPWRHNHNRCRMPCGEYFLEILRNGVAEADEGEMWKNPNVGTMQHVTKGLSNTFTCGGVYAMYVSFWYPPWLPSGKEQQRLHFGMCIFIWCLWIVRERGVSCRSLWFMFCGFIWDVVYVLTCTPI